MFLLFAYLCWRVATLAHDLAGGKYAPLERDLAGSIRRIARFLDVATNEAN
jgi:hypothetical protein